MVLLENIRKINIITLCFIVNGANSKFCIQPKLAVKWMAHRNSCKSIDFRFLCIAIKFSKLNLSHQIKSLTWKFDHKFWPENTVIQNPRFLRDHCWYNSLEIMTSCSGYKKNASQVMAITILQGSQKGLLEL